MKIDNLLEFIKTNCILRKSQGDKIYARNGTEFVWALDLRRALLDPESLITIAEEFFKAHVHMYPYQLAAIEMSGVPMMTAIQTVAKRLGVDINGMIVRKKRKKYLQQDHIDGKSNGAPIIVLDDSLSSGSTIENAIVKLRDAGHEISHAFVIVNFNSSHGVDNMMRQGVMVTSMFDLTELGLTYDRPHRPKTDYKIAWTFASPNPNLQFAVAKSKPVIHKDSIIFGSDCGTVWCLENGNGRIKWFYGTQDNTGKGVISSPCVSEGKVYFGSYDGTMYCLDADTGKTEWANPCCNWIGSSPVVVDNEVFIGLEYNVPGRAGAMACFNKYTGELKYTIPTRVQLHGSPVYAPDHHVLIWGTNDGTVAVLDIASRSVVRQLEGLKAVKYPAAVSGDLAVFGAFDGGIYVWDYVKNQIKFRYQTEDLVYSTPLIVEDRAFMGSSDNQFVVIDLKNFTLVASFDMKEKVHSSPTLINGIVWFGTSKGELIGMHPVTLNVVYQYQFPERLTNAIMSDGRRLFVYAFDNKMWAVEHG